MNNLNTQTAYVGSAEITQVRKGDRLVLAPNGDKLWYDSNELPSLDLRFAEDKSLVDATTGSNLVDFTRASSGTYVGSDGLIKTAVTNLLLQSEDFSTTWSASGASVSADQTIAPDGNTTADKLVCGTGTPIYQGIQQAITATSSATRFSVYVKAAEIDQVELRSFNPADLAIFELSTQQVLSQSGSPDPTITDAGNGWYRCSITSSSSAATSFRISLASGGNRTFTPIPGAGLYLWGAQLEQSSTVGEYIPTTSTINSAPRFDHDPTTGESLGLLVEESRTNLLEYSEDFTDPYWGSNNVNGTITTNQAAAPDGTITANLYTEDNTTNGRYFAKSNSFTSGTFYTISIWAKQASGTRYLGFVLQQAAFGSTCIASFTLSGPGSYNINSSGTGTTANIQQFSNGWYRCSLTSQATVTTFAGVQFRLSSSPINGATSYTGDGTSGIYIWGAQLEAGSFPTSYIPTSGSGGDRSADVASITGANFSSWYRQDEGTVFVDFQLNTVSVNNLAFSINDNSFANRQAIYTPTTTSLRYRSITSNTNDVAISFVTIAGGRRKAVGAYKVNDFAFALDTGDFQTDTSAAVPPATQLNIGSEFNGAASLNNTIRRFTYWPARLPNETLQTITQ